MEGEFSSRSLVLRLRLAEGSSLRLALLGTKIWCVVGLPLRMGARRMFALLRTKIWGVVGSP